MGQICGSKLRRYERPGTSPSWDPYCVVTLGLLDGCAGVFVVGLDDPVLKFLLVRLWKVVLEEVGPISKRCSGFEDEVRAMGTYSGSADLF